MFSRFFQIEEIQLRQALHVASEQTTYTIQKASIGLLTVEEFSNTETTSSSSVPTLTGLQLLAGN
eukprot:m.96301 g.96301  ORF g.96301 m.96301 type:complete len:65 (+) comp13539_c0_seq7:465-659(+)